MTRRMPARKRARPHRFAQPAVLGLDPLLLAHLHAVGAAVHFADLSGEGVIGLADLDEGVILVDSGLTPVEIRCTIGHELAHFHLGHRPTGDPVADAEMEDEAERWAADVLIPPIVWDWAAGLARDDRELAEILGVDGSTVAARRKLAAERSAVAA